MRYLTTAAMALVLAVGAAAAEAQPQNNDQTKAPPARDSGDHASGGQSNHGAGQGGGQSGRASGQSSGNSQAHFNGQASNGRAGANGGQNYRGGVRGPNTYVPASGFVVGPQGGAGAYGAGAHPGAFRAPAQAGIPGADHAPRGRDAGRAWYNPGATPQRFAAQQRFHADWNNRPSGWYAHTWVFGEFLPFGWFDEGYYLDWDGYDLPQPPIGCEWVREGDDALLVDVWSGQVLSVDYGVFW
jgi:Ni/Co efflux regulator RcnB